MNNETAFLFVYGTLLKYSFTEMAAFLEQNSSIVGKGSFPGLLYDLKGYPGAIYRPDVQTRVYGTILRLKNIKHTLKKLDEYEEIGPNFPLPHEYIRKIIPIDTKGKFVKCWGYLYNHSVEDKKIIRSGKYIDQHPL